MSFRVCSECDSLFNEGYCIEDGWNYYCSDECLEKNMTFEEYEKLRESEDCDTYWTEWYSCGIEYDDLEILHHAVKLGKIENVKCIIEGYTVDEQKTIFDYLQNKGVFLNVI